eukprot:446494_1
MSSLGVASSSESSSKEQSTHTSGASTKDKLARAKREKAAKDKAEKLKKRKAAAARRKKASTRKQKAHETVYGDLFDNYDYSPISQWNDNYDDVNVGHSMLLDSDNNHNLHREMALGAIGLLVITCCLFACCIERRPKSFYDAIASDHEEV